jgi:hypothetical protein
MVYLWKKDGVIYHHTDLEAAAQIDGLTEAPDETVEDADFEAAGSIARLVGGKIILGKTAAEKQAEEDEQKIITLKRQLAETDYIAAKIAEGSATVKEYAEQIAQRQAWRQEINRLAS